MTGMVQPHEMRASDADRDRIAAILRDAHAEGRLTQPEFDDRLTATYEATTYRDLDQVILDLPTDRGQLVRGGQQSLAPKPPPGPIKRKARRAARVSLNAGWWCWGSAVAINLVIWLILALVQTDVPYPWPVWVAGPWGVVMLIGELAYRRGEPLD
jgi:hypothetical protein